MPFSTSRIFKMSNLVLKDDAIYSGVSYYCAIFIIKFNGTSGNILTSIQRYVQHQVHLCSIIQNGKYIYFTIRRRSDVNGILKYHMENEQTEVHMLNFSVIITIDVQADKERMILAGRLNYMWCIARSRYIYTLDIFDYNQQAYTSLRTSDIGLQHTVPTIQSIYVTGTDQEVSFQIMRQIILNGTSIKLVMFFIGITPLELM